MKAVSETMSKTALAAAAAASLLMSLSPVSSSGVDPCTFVGTRTDCGPNCLYSRQCAVWGADRLRNVTEEAKRGQQEDTFNNMCLGFKVGQSNIQEPAYFARSPIPVLPRLIPHFSSTTIALDCRWVGSELPRYESVPHKPHYLLRNLGTDSPPNRARG